MTELQYDRIVKWSKGEFTKDPVKKYTCFEEIPLEEQPAALTRAALEATIGSPLYPGIEMSWNAELSATYDLENPFTINPDVKPGDLTKYLSLPWQSDFYMCRNYWSVKHIHLVLNSILALFSQVAFCPSRRSRDRRHLQHSFSIGCKSERGQEAE